MTSNVAVLGSYRGFACDKTPAVQVYTKCEGGVLVEFVCHILLWLETMAGYHIFISMALGDYNVWFDHWMF